MKVLTLLAALGIQFAATDIIVNETGDYVFLETNPHGAWMWIEDQLGDTRISEAVAAHIEKALG